MASEDFFCEKQGRLYVCFIKLRHRGITWKHKQLPTPQRTHFPRKCTGCVCGIFPRFGTRRRERSSSLKKVRLFFVNKISVRRRRWKGGCWESMERGTEETDWLKGRLPQGIFHIWCPITTFRDFLNPALLLFLASLHYLSPNLTYWLIFCVDVICEIPLLLSGSNTQIWDYRPLLAKGEQRKGL